MNECFDIFLQALCHENEILPFLTPIYHKEYSVNANDNAVNISFLSVLQQDSAKNVFVLHGHITAVKSLSFCSSGLALVSGGIGGLLNIWSLQVKKKKEKKNHRIFLSLTYTRSEHHVILICII